ncbi:MAG: shikimate dehydrogenase [Actinomycetes bacterium]
MIQAAVLGHPVGHSLSPTLHKCAYEVLGWDWDYTAIEVKSGDLAQFIAANRRIFRGLSLTMPLKEEALMIADSLDPLVKRINAANTLIFEDHEISAYSTDVSGFAQALAKAEVVIPNEITILGGGATARSAIAALDIRGRTITVYSRSASRAAQLINSAISATVEVKDWSEAQSGLSANLIIATTPSGATDHLIPTQTSGTLFESLYSPWPTKLLGRWKDAGGKYIDGLDLLVEQGIGQIELMAYEPLTLDLRSLAVTMRAAGLQKLGL